MSGPRGPCLVVTTYPSIGSFLSTTAEEFIALVERHASERGPLYRPDTDSGLPGDSIRMSVTWTDGDDDVAELHHTLEFMSLDRDGHWQTVGAIRHSLKQIESLQGRSIQIQSTFDIDGPGIPNGRFRRAEVERAVCAHLDRLNAWTRTRRFSRQPGRTAVKQNCTQAK